VVMNPHSFAVFNGYRVLLSTQQTLTPSLFKKDDWKTYDVKEPVDQERVRKAQARAETLKILETHHSRFSWNTTEDASLVKVCLMAQGTTSETAWKIAQGGFGVVASLDPGWSGQGQIFSYSYSFSFPFPSKVSDFPCL